MMTCLTYVHRTDRGVGTYVLMMYALQMIKRNRLQITQQIVTILENSVLEGTRAVT